MDNDDIFGNCGMCESRHIRLFRTPPEWQVGLLCLPCWTDVALTKEEPGSAEARLYDQTAAMLDIFRNVLINHQRQADGQ
jgi:hypothetical protein